MNKRSATSHEHKLCGLLRKLAVHLAIPMLTLLEAGFAEAKSVLLNAMRWSSNCGDMAESCISSNQIEHVAGHLSEGHRQNK